MSTETIISAKLLNELQNRLRNAVMGIRNPDEMLKASQHMDEMREELRQRIGTVEVAVDLIRETRDE